MIISQTLFIFTLFCEHIKDYHQKVKLTNELIHSWSKGKLDR